MNSLGNVPRLHQLNLVRVFCNKCRVNRWTQLTENALSIFLVLGFFFPNDLLSYWCLFCSYFVPFSQGIRCHRLRRRRTAAAATRRAACRLCISNPRRLLRLLLLLLRATTITSTQRPVPVRSRPPTSRRRVWRPPRASWAPSPGAPRRRRRALRLVRAERGVSRRRRHLGRRCRPLPPPWPRYWGPTFPAGSPSTPTSFRAR